MTAPIIVRDYTGSDRAAVDRVVHTAWDELAPLLPGWDLLAPRLGVLTEKAADSEVIVAERAGQIVGAAGYLGPQHPRQDFFEPGWGAVRMMSVAPSARGHGIGRLLLDELVARTRRDGLDTLALHTTPLMAAAQRLYRGYGFERLRALPDQWGAPYILMTLRL